VATETSVGILKWVTWRSIKKMDGGLMKVPTGISINDRYHLSHFLKPMRQFDLGPNHKYL
jgi:hypothetical protein